MKTLEVIQMPESLLVSNLKSMKLKELERHATKMLAKLGHPDYNEAMKILIRAVPKLKGSQDEKFSKVKSLIRDLVPTAVNQSEINDALIERLSVILMLAITQKFERIMSES